jgi:hypothetical protein
MNDILPAVRLTLSTAMGLAWSVQCLELPGPDPGPAEVSVEADAIELRNATLTVNWRWKDSGLTSSVFSFATARGSLALSGELFQITMADGTRHPASAFRLQSRPRETLIGPDAVPRSGAGAVRGRRVEIPLETRDGNFAVIWRAILRDGASYVRQELEITAVADDRPSATSRGWTRGCLERGRLAEWMDLRLSRAICSWVSRTRWR